MSQITAITTIFPVNKQVQKTAHSCNLIRSKSVVALLLHSCKFASLSQQLLSFHYYLTVTEYYKIGKLVAVHGLKGELLLKHELGKKTSMKGLETVFIEEKKNSFLPWFIQSTKIKNNEEVYLKLESIDTRESAMKLVRKELWVPEAQFKKLAAKTAPASLLGYMIMNKQEALGEIQELIEQPHQLLCRLDIKGKEVLIPLHENSLQKVDHKKKLVWVDLPDGLLEIYLT